MKAALPLARSLGASILTKPSRIPHLEYHILRKSKSKHAAPRQSSRHQTTLSASLHTSSNAWSRDVEAIDEAECGIDEREAAPEPPVKPYLPNPDQIDFRHASFFDAAASPQQQTERLHHVSQEPDVYQLLEEACPERLLSWLTAHPSAESFIQNAPDADFDRAFTALDPAILIEPYKRMQKLGLVSRDDKSLPVSSRRSLVLRQRRFVGAIDNIIVRRQEYGHQVTLNLCRHLLKCAAAAGDARAADLVWTKLMPTSGIVPDITCYNALMHAFVWNLAYSEIARQSFQFYRRNAELREKKWRPRNLLGYSISQKDRDLIWTLRGKLLASFQALSADGLTTNEETFINLIVGMARSGDISGVESILKSVWNIDVNALSKFDEEEIESPTFYDNGHPLRPTSNLLWAIAHAYCINNNTTQAWSVVDYVSRNYAIDISEDVWDELYEWNFVLSRIVGRFQKTRGQDQGRIPLYSLEELHLRASDEPYNLNPSPNRMNLLAKSMRERKVLKKTTEAMHMLEEMLKQQLQQLQLMVDTFVALTETEYKVLEGGILSKPFVEFRRDFQLAFLSAQTSNNHLLAHVRLMLTEKDWAGSGHQTLWSRQRLPAVLEEFEEFAPLIFAYNTKSGRVILRREKPEKLNPTQELLYKASVIFTALAPHDLQLVTENLSKLPEALTTLPEITYNEERMLTREERQAASAPSSEEVYKPWT